MFAIFANGSNSGNFKHENLFYAKYTLRAFSQYRLFRLYYVYSASIYTLYFRFRFIVVSSRTGNRTNDRAITF